MTHHTDFADRLGRLNDVLCAANTLQWDARVMMPPEGAATRGHQLATLKGIARQMILDPALAGSAEALLNDPCATTRRAAKAVLEAKEYHARIPATLLRRQAEQSALAGAAWAEARAKRDFLLFKPWLEEVVRLARETAEATGYDAHPYDAMVKVFEPGETAASITTLFDTLSSGIKPILDAARGRPAPRTDFLYRHYPPEAQQRFCAAIAESLGYDRARGRLDTAVHPFEISFTRQDVRITSRWEPHYLPMSIFGTIHETGHALYEMGVDPDLTRSAHATDMIGLYAVGGTSFGMHESQSRLLENHVGRTPAFWERHFGTLCDFFPEQLSDVTLEEWIASVNRVEPGPIRVQADELTYDLHIMLRVRIEMALIDGSLAVADIPGVWNDAMREDLSVDVPDDALGCLQDVHWSSGYIGSFPTYTIGNVTAAQIMAHLDRTRPDIRVDLERGETKALREELKNTVWRYGRSQNRREIVELFGVVGSDASAYLTYLQKKFGS